MAARPVFGRAARSAADGTAWLSTSRDSTRNHQANAATSAARPAAPSPTNSCPPSDTISEPNAGPATAPRLVIAESQPRLLVRCSGGDTSAT